MPTTLSTTGIEITVMRPDYLRGASCSNGGLTERHDTVLVVPADIDPADLLAADQDRAVVIEVRTIGRRYATLRPLVPRNGSKAVGPMAGGCFVGIGPALLAELQALDAVGDEDGTVAIHDRWETQEQYNALSRD